MPTVGERAKLLKSLGFKVLGEYKGGGRLSRKTVPPDRFISAFLRKWNPDQFEATVKNYKCDTGPLEDIYQKIGNIGRRKPNRGQFPELEETFKAAERLVQRQIIVRKVSPVCPTRLKSLNTSSGFPDFKPRNDPEQKYLEVKRAIYVMEELRSNPRMTYGEFLNLVPPCKVEVLPQTSDKFSSRIVFMYPMMVNILENMFMEPFWDLQLRLQDSPFLTGRDQNLKASKFIHQWKDLVSIDLRQADSSIPKFLIRMAFRIFRSGIDFSRRGAYDLNRSDTIMQEKTFDMLEKYFIETPMVVDEVLVMKNGAIPSGSLFTLGIFSIVSLLLMQIYSLTISDFALVPGYYYSCGDDSIMVVTIGFELDRLIRLGSLLGIDIHPDKTVLSINRDNHHRLTVLSTNYSEHRRLKRDVNKLFAKAIFSKQYSWHAERSVARAMQIDMASGSSNPPFSTFVSWMACTSGWKLRRKITTDRDLERYYRTVLNRDVPFGGTEFRHILEAYRDRTYYLGVALSN